MRFLHSLIVAPPPPDFCVALLHMYEIDFLAFPMFKRIQFFRKFRWMIWCDAAKFVPDEGREVKSELEHLSQ